MRRTYSRDPLTFWLGAVPSLVMAVVIFSGPSWSDLWRPGDYWGFVMPGAIFTAFGLVILYNCWWAKIDLASRRVTTYRAGILRRRIYGFDDFERITVSREEVEGFGFLVRLEGSGYELIVGMRRTSHRARSLAADLTSFTGLAIELPPQRSTPP